jgi:hypothetical protein
MSRLSRERDLSAVGTTGRAPDTDYPVAYPMASSWLPRFACSLGVRGPLAARTFSRTSRSLTAGAGVDGSVWSRGMHQEFLGGQRGGWLPVALINFPLSLPCTCISTAPTDEMEGGGS